MEQTVNTWNKGLQMDTHPMVLSNDTLSDALNATFVTMNGNEVILLNDMGNRRVDNAFLPPGYLPVGMKEYGGIIYVAAYNPITDKSQIGSFPSPEKRISEVDDSDLGGTFDFDSIFLSPNISYDSNLKLMVLNNDTFLVPISGENSLRAGDKFAIWALGLSSMSSKLTNYENISDNDSYKAKSPKNKKYTLLVGVLNSQNEFVDITKSLCRWDTQTNQIINFNKEVSEIYKFNKGYFIPADFTSPNFDLTIKDSLLIRERLKIAANTYSYKLIGPLYLKIIYNHIQNLNYNIYGVKDLLLGKTTIWVEAVITYNCPDNSNLIVGNEITSNEYYSNLGEVMIEQEVAESSPIKGIPAFHFYDYSLDPILLLLPVNNKYKISKIQYNLNANLYSCKVTKLYEINLTTGKFEYVIGALPGIYELDLMVNNNKFYLRGLSSKGSLDLDLLGTGTIKINGWKFYNSLEKGTTTLTVSFDAYPRYNRYFGGLYFLFYPIEGGEGVRYPEEGTLPIYNGRQTFNIDWKNRFTPRTLYYVVPFYTVYNTETNEPVYHKIETVYETIGGHINGYIIGKSITEEENTALTSTNDIIYTYEIPILDVIPYSPAARTILRWFLSTELFNEFYQPSSGIDDFCNVDSLLHPEFYSKMVINLGVKNTIVNNSKNEEETFVGGLVLKDENYIYYACKLKLNLDISTNSRISIVNEELYPSSIFVKEDMKNKVTITGCNITKMNDYGNIFYKYMFENCLSYDIGEEVGNDNANLEDKFKGLDKINIELSHGSNSVGGYIEYSDNYLGYNTSGITNPKNVFGSLFDELLPELKNIASNQHIGYGTYSGIFVNFDSREGPPDGHFIDVCTNLPLVDYLSNNFPTDSELPTGALRAYEVYDDRTVTVQFKNILDDVFLYFNLSLDPTLTFLYLALPGSSGVLISNTSNRNSGINSHTNYWSRVWWRTIDNKWALIDPVFKLTQAGNTANLVKGEAGLNDDGDFVKYLKKDLFTNIDRVYCVYDLYEGTISSVHATDKNRIYNKGFNIKTILSIYYGILNGITANDIVEGTTLQYNVDFVTYPQSICNLGFTVNPEIPNINPCTVTLELKSSDKFLNTVAKFRTDSIEGIDVLTGQMFDTDGNPLNRNYMYYYSISGYNLGDIPSSTSIPVIYSDLKYGYYSNVDGGKFFERRVYYNSNPDDIYYNGQKLTNVLKAVKIVYELYTCAAAQDFETTGLYTKRITREEAVFQLLFYLSTNANITDPYYYLGGIGPSGTNYGNRKPYLMHTILLNDVVQTLNVYSGKRGDQLTRIKNNYVTIKGPNDPDGKINGKNIVYYNRHDTIGFPTYRYDHSGLTDNDMHTILDYGISNIVKL